MIAKSRRVRSRKMIGGDSDSRFESLVSRTPWSWEKVLAWGLSWFISEQEPDEVEFEMVSNGYVLKVKTDDQNSMEAAKFWKEHVQPRLRGEE